MKEYQGGADFYMRKFFIFLLLLFFPFFALSQEPLPEPEPEPEPVVEPFSFGESITITSTSTWFECQFLSPTYWDNTDNKFRELSSGTNPVHFAQQQSWFYARATCTSPALQNIASGTTSFYLEKVWDYGQLFLAFLLILFILFYFAGSIFKFFFENFIRIKRKND